MKKRLNLTIDSELYDALENLPRKVSVSEIVNFILRGIMLQIAKGRELTDEEIKAEIERAGGEEFRQRLISVLGPTIDRIDFGIEKIKELLAIDPGTEPQKAK
jgi:hypothetical protein